MIELLQLHNFVPLVGQSFEVRGGDQVVRLELEMATVAGGRAPHANRDPFSLQFRGPLDARLSQGTYGFDLGPLGAHQIFIVPIARDHQGFHYEAIFS